VRKGRTDGSYSVGPRLDAGASLSGYQRNRLFLNLDGRNFIDVSGLSGADSPADGRACAQLDYDRDGRVDLVLVNANEPLCQLYQNGSAAGQMLALRFVGGNNRAEPSNKWSARDGYGAEVEVVLGEKTLLREHRAGEGFSTQNSATMIIGLGEYEKVDAVRVSWPSGRVHVMEHVEAGLLLTVYENADHSPANEAYVTAPYFAKTK
jgi:hypothetical protein